MTVVTAAAAAGSSYGHTGADHRHAAPRAQVRAAQTEGKTTLQQTLKGGDPKLAFSFLGLAAGEPHLLREDLAAAQAGRQGRRRSLLYTVQITDLQLADEESPARVEFLDADPSGTAQSAWRPQEALLAHQTELTMRQINNFLQSPITQGDGGRADLANAVLTGDLADNQQKNETEWVVRLLEGGTLNPNSGTDDLEGTLCENLVNPDLDDPANYTGVQDYDDYFENPAFYDPEKPLGDYADRNWPVYAGLMDQAQKPFEAQGLRVPSYVAFGNHDALVQGNEDANAAFEEVATGCVKPLAAPGPGLLDALSPTFLASVINDPTKALLVPPDQNRQFVDRRQFRALHQTGGQSDRHGFSYIDSGELQDSDGDASYYSFSPKAGIRYIVLDTVCVGGITPVCSDGNVDDPQFRWLEAELAEATERNELIMVFGHHATGSLEASIPDEIAPPCKPPVGSEPVDDHDHNVNPGCDRDPRPSQPLHLGADLEKLFHRFPHVIGYVAGHSHENRIAPLKRERGGIWEIKSPAIADFPPQHRLIEVMDNRDGTLSIFGTLADDASPPSLTAQMQSRSHGGSHFDASGFGVSELASVGRTLTYNDPQVGPQDFPDDDGGQPGAEGGPDGQPRDRNVELLIKDPRRASASAAPGGGAGDPDGDGDGEEPGPGQTVAADTGDLPFTGYPLVPPAVLGLLLCLLGVLGRLRLRGQRS